MSELTSSTRMGEWRRGWRVAVAAAIGTGVGTGMYAFLSGLFIDPLQAAFGWSRSEIAVVSLFAIPMVLLLPLIGRFIDRFGARPIGMGALILFSGGFVGLSAMSGQLWQYYAFQAFMTVIGLATSVVVFTRPVAAWFDKMRGTALGFAIAGASAASFVLYPALQFVISNFGWRMGYLFLAALPLFIGVPVIWRWLSPAPPQPTHGVDGRAYQLPGATVRQAAGDARFWLLVAAMILGNIPVGGILNQLQPLLHAKGFGPETAALMGSLFAASVALGRVGAGVLLDRLRPSIVFTLCLAAPILGAWIMLHPSPLVWAAAIATISFGLAQGTEADFLAFLVARYFGLRYYATLYGALMAATTVGLSSGVVIYANAYDHFGGYGVALKAQMVLMAITAGLLITSEWLHGRRGGVALGVAVAKPAPSS